MALQDTNLVARSAMTGAQSQASILHRRGRFREAISILDNASGSDDATSLLLRARLSLPLSPAGAIATLSDPRFAGYSLFCRAEAAMLRARGHMQLGEHGPAEESLTVARALAVRCGVDHGDLSRDIELSVGALSIARSRIDDAERIANELRAKEKAPGTAATLVLLAQVAWRRERLDATVSYLLQALAAISADAVPDVQLWAETLRRFAHVLCYAPSPAGRALLARHATALPWTDDLGDLHSQVYRLLGTRAVIDGAITEALAFYKRAFMTPAATLTSRVLAMLSRAECYLWLGEPFSFEDQLLEATALAQQLDWRAVSPSAREILLVLAQLHARRDPSLALSYAALYESLGGIGTGVGWCADAQQNYCLGVLYTAVGEHGKGVAMLEAAFAEFVRLGYDWAAGMAAINLAEVTNSTLWRSRARERLARYPDSLFNLRLARLSGLGDSGTRGMRSVAERDPRASLLTRTQRTVYYRLLEDVSVKEIASDFKRSELTVRNHIQAIFRKFGVNSRADLVGPPTKPPVEGDVAL